MKFIIDIYITLAIIFGINCTFNIYLIPYIHVKSGFDHTVDEYHELNISLSFNYMLECLTSNNNLTFVIDEIIYFIKWYKNELKPELKTKLKN